MFSKRKVGLQYENIWEERIQKQQILEIYRQQGDVIGLFMFSKSKVG
jgi:hypothetical protein